MGKHLLLFCLDKFGSQGLANTEFEHFFILILSLLFNLVLVLVGLDELLILLEVIVLDVGSDVNVHLKMIFKPTISLSFKHLIDLVCTSLLFQCL